MGYTLVVEYDETMTIITVILLGTGALLVVSAIDGCDLLTTFQHIINNDRKSCV